MLRSPLCLLLLSVTLLTMTCVGCDPDPGKTSRTGEEGNPKTPEVRFDLTPVPADPGPRPHPIPSEPPTDDPPRFMGISQLIAGDGVITLQWEPAWDDETATEELRYRVYISTERQDESKFDRPPATETKPGVTGAQLTGFPNGVTLYVVVRAVDRAGNMDDNELEWSATPNPVFYVQKDAPSHGDGRTPATPLPDLLSAISEAIPLPEGANIYLAEGKYEESTLLLIFDGMMLYGGFAPGFPEGLSKPREFRTLLSNPQAETLLMISPGEKMCGVDGIEFFGSGRVRRGIEAENCEFRISNCEIHEMTEKGIRIKSDTKQDSITLGEISRCWIYDNTGSGIDMRGVLDIAITGCGIYQNQGEGIEINGLTATPAEKSRITIEGCRIAENQDVGIQIKAVALPDGESDDSRIRMKIRSCEISHNTDIGVLIDVAYPDGIDINLRARIEQCRIVGNYKSGIRLDGDARGHFQMTRNQVLGNGGHPENLDPLGTRYPGIHLTGDGAVTFFQIQSSAILANEGDGVYLDSAGHLSIDHSHIAGNGRAAFFHKSDTWIRVEDSLFHDNVVPAHAELLESCIASPGQLTNLEPTDGAPWLDTLPKRILRLPKQVPGSAPDLSSLDLEAGTLIEWCDDGIARRVTVDASGAKRLDPAPQIQVIGIPFLYDWGRPAEGTTPSLVEDYRAPEGSKLRNTGNKNELEADGSPADIGPAGAFFAGHPGIDRGGAPPPRGLELSWIEPAPGALIHELNFTLSFTGGTKLPPEIEVRLSVNGERLENLTVESRRTVLYVSSPTEISAGDVIEFELPPWPFESGGRSQPLDHVFKFRGAYAISADSVVDRFPATGSIILPGLATQTLPFRSDRDSRIRLLGVSPPGGRGWTMRIREEGSSDTVKTTAGVELSATGKSDLDGALRLTIPALPTDKKYVLEIDPPGETSYESDGQATLYWSN